MKLNQRNESMKGNPKRGLGHGVTVAVVGSVSSKNSLSPEFFGLICEWDPKAVNDDYYVRSCDFVELHSRIKRELIRDLLFWAVALCIGMAGLTLAFG